MEQPPAAEDGGDAAVVMELLTGAGGWYSHIALLQLTRWLVSYSERRSCWTVRQILAASNQAVKCSNTI